MGLQPAPGNEDTAANTAHHDLAPPAKGFGQLWRKRFAVVLHSPGGPEEVIALLRRELPALWPEHARLYTSYRGISAGEMAGLEMGVGPVTLSTGVLVTEATATAFTLQSPEGHMLSGSTRFTAEPREGGVEVAITVQFRASDPLYELGFVLGGHRIEERFWAAVLRNLGRRYGEAPRVRMTRVRLERRRQWRHARNVRYNAAIRTMIRRAGRLPVAAMRRARRALNAG